MATVTIGLGGEAGRTDGEAGWPDRELPIGSTNRFDRCPDCRAMGSIRLVDDRQVDRAVCLVCGVHLRRRLSGGGWAVETYGDQV